MQVSCFSPIPAGLLLYPPTGHGPDTETMKALLITAGAGLALSVFGYIYGLSNGKDIERAKAAIAYAAKVAENAALARQLSQLTQDVENDLKPRLEASDARNSSLADSLRRYQARRCTLPNPSGSPAEPSGSAGESGDSGAPTEADRALESHLEACGRDAERLGAFQDWYSDLRRSFAPQ